MKGNRDGRGVRLANSNPQPSPQPGLPESRAGSRGASGEGLTLCPAKVLGLCQRRGRWLGPATTGEEKGRELQNAFVCGATPQLPAGNAQSPPCQRTRTAPPPPGHPTLALLHCPMCSGEPRRTCSGLESSSTHILHWEEALAGRPTRPFRRCLLKSWLISPLPVVNFATPRRHPVTS